MSSPATNMAADRALPRPEFDRKFGAFKRNILRAYLFRKPLRALDAAAGYIGDILADIPRDKPLDRPVLILGQFRSGTTLLERVVSLHPAVGYFTYLTSAFPRAPRFGKFMGRMVPGFMDPMVPPHQPNLVVDGSWPFEAEPLWRFCRNNLWTNAPHNVLDVDYSDPAFERLLVRVIHKQLALQGATRFVHKNPTNLVRLGFLARVLPTARFVHIVRDPRRVLRSQLDMVQIVERIFQGQPTADYAEAFSNLYAPPAPMFMRTPRHREIAAAFAHDRALGGALSLADIDECFTAMVDRSQLHDRVYTVRYEDLIQNFAPVMDEIFDFIGLAGTDARAATTRAESELVNPKLVSATAAPPQFSPQVLQTLAPIITKYQYPAV